METKYPSFGIVTATPEVEDTFYIQLAGVHWAFPRQRFQSLFPDSMVVAALESSSETIIPLENPSVTPEIISYLWFITKYRFTLPPLGMVTKHAGDYLGIPILLIAANSCLRTIPKLGNLLEKQAMQQAGKYWHVVSAAAKVEAIDVLRYIFQLIPAEITLEMDGILMLDASINGWSEVFRVLLRRGLNPMHITETGRHSHPFMELMVSDERGFDYDDTLEVAERPAFTFLRKQEYNQIPYIVLLAPVIMQPGHKAILKMLLEVGLPDELILSMGRAYITHAHVCLDVVKMLLGQLQHLQLMDILGLYPVIVERHLTEVYAYFHHELKIRAGLDHVAAMGDISEVQPYISMITLVDAELRPLIRAALEKDHSDVASILILKLSPEAKLELLVDSLENAERLEFLLRQIPVETKSLSEWMDSILQKGQYGLVTLMVLSKQPDMSEFLQARLQNPDYTMDLSWRQMVAKAMGISLPAVLTQVN